MFKLLFKVKSIMLFGMMFFGIVTLIGCYSNKDDSKKDYTNFYDDINKETINQIPFGTSRLAYYHSNVIKNKVVNNDLAKRIISLPSSTDDAKEYIDEYTEQIDCIADKNELIEYICNVDFNYYNLFFKYRICTYNGKYMLQIRSLNLTENNIRKMIEYVASYDYNFDFQEDETSLFLETINISNRYVLIDEDITNQILETIMEKTGLYEIYCDNNYFSSLLLMINGNDISFVKRLLKLFVAYKTLILSNDMNNIGYYICEELFTNQENYDMDEKFDEIKKIYMYYVSNTKFISDDSKKIVNRKLEKVKLSSNIINQEIYDALEQNACDSSCIFEYFEKKENYILMLLFNGIINENIDVGVGVVSRYNSNYAYEIAFYIDDLNLIYLSPAIFSLLESKDISWDDIEIILSHEIAHALDYENIIKDELLTEDEIDIFELFISDLNIYLDNACGIKLDGKKTREFYCDFFAIRVVIAKNENRKKEIFKLYALLFAENNGNDNQIVFNSSGYLPAKYRINCVVELLDDFYECYPMYKKKKGIGWVLW